MNKKKRLKIFREVDSLARACMLAEKVDYDDAIIRVLNKNDTLCQSFQEAVDGKWPARIRQSAMSMQMSEWEQDEDSGTDTEEAFDEELSGFPAPKLEKTDPRVKYRASGPERCAECRLFLAPQGCRFVEGTIDKEYFCKLWTARPALFNEEKKMRRTTDPFITAAMRHTEALRQEQVEINKTEKSFSRSETFDEQDLKKDDERRKAFNDSPAEEYNGDGDLVVAQRDDLAKLMTTLQAAGLEAGEAYVRASEMSELGAAEGARLIRELTDALKDPTSVKGKARLARLLAKSKAIATSGAEQYAEGRDATNTLEDIEVAVSQIMAAQPDTNYADAMSAAFERDEVLYERYKAYAESTALRAGPARLVR